MPALAGLCLGFRRGSTSIITGFDIGRFNDGRLNLALGIGAMYSPSSDRPLGLAGGLGTMYSMSSECANDLRL